jgi:hypothetical protein
MTRGSQDENVWSIVLAGGDGERLKPSCGSGWDMRSLNSIVRLWEHDPCFNIRWIVPMKSVRHGTK